MILFLKYFPTSYLHKLKVHCILFFPFLQIKYSQRNFSQVYLSALAASLHIPVKIKNKKSYLRLFVLKISTTNLQYF